MPSHGLENTLAGVEPVQSIEAGHAPIYDLDRLLDAMSTETFPEEIDFGRPAGKEFW